MPLRQDFIGRLIQQLADFFARALKQIQEGQLDEAEATIAEAERSLGLPRGMERLDARSAAMMLGGGDKVVLAALLLEQKALMAASRGREADAKTLRARAQSLLSHAKPHELGTEAGELAERLH
ncbi:MAG: hypothetical protein KC776_02165 [Myxococcales bacterium]|nr:hypothetical protein [Myxococcales bacterium]MCB9582391.1 hypothetical protein [Polyangiaceae bacterium]